MANRGKQTGAPKGYPSLQTDSGIVLDQPDLEQMKTDRFERNRQFMIGLNKYAAEATLPQDKVLRSRTEEAAVCIQRNYRGHLGRKQYVALLYDQFSKEEKLQLEKSLAHAEEGELLVENHKLEVLLDDNTTTRKNRARNYLSRVITIQRAWRAYANKKHVSDTDVKLELSEDLEELKIINDGSEKGNMLVTIATNSETSEDVKSVTLEENNSQKLEQNSSREITPDDGSYPCIDSPAHRVLNRVKQEHDTDRESVSSDYSEISSPLKDIAESEVTIVEKSQLAEGLFAQPSSKEISQQDRKPTETEEEYVRRLKKANYLSIAQEFAELKKVNSDILPFDLHKGYQSGSSCSETSSIPSQRSSEMNTPCDPSDSFVQLNNGVNNLFTTDVNCNINPNTQQGGDNSTDNEQNNLSNDNTRTSHNSHISRGDNSNREAEGDFEVYNVESLPQMNWDMLEQQIQQVTQQQEKRQESQRNDREEIRRKLAMGLDEEYYGGERSFKKPNLSTRLQSGMNLQICFMNEAPGEEAGESSLQAGEDKVAQSKTKINKPGMLDSRSMVLPDNGEKDKSEKEDFFKKQARLQQEAKIALAQASTMAHMQLEVEKQRKKKSPTTDIVGLPILPEGAGLRLGTRYLHEMNVGQLQVLVNNLHCQIESLNENLVKLLMERDELHMGQDSMLVDIEDLTRRAEDKAKRLTTNQKPKKDSRKS